MPTHGPLKPLILAAALSMGGHVACELLAPLTGARLASQAQAQVRFKGKIKRIRIKKMRVGGGYKVVARTSSDTASTVAGATVALTAADSGEPLGQLDLGGPQRAQRTSTFDLNGNDIQVTNGELLSISVTSRPAGGNDDDVTVSTIADVALTDADGTLRGEGVGDDGFKVRLRVNRAGALVAVLMNEDKAWQGDALQVTARVDGGAPISATTTEVRQRRVANTGLDLAAVGPVQVATTLFGPDGEVLDTRTETVSVDDTALAQVDRIAVRETRRGDTKLVTITTDSGGEASLATTLTDAETGEVVLETVDDSPVSRVRAFYAEGLAFDPGASPAGHPYLCLIDLLDEQGDPVGEQYEVELQVPERADGAVTTHVAPFGDGVGRVVVAADDDGYAIGVGLRGGDGVVAANLIFEEPFEGPAPLETEISADFRAGFSKWIQKGAGALPNAHAVSVTLTEGGAVVGSVQGASGEGSGTVYRAAGNGKGTRKSVATMQQVLPLL